MEVSQNIIDKVDDALIHFEDENFKIEKDYVIHIIDNDKFGNYNEEELISLVTNSTRTDNEVQFGLAVIVRIDKSKVRKRFDDYVWFTQNIKMAILRITDDEKHDDIFIDDGVSSCRFIVPITKIKLKNLKKLGNLIKDLDYKIKRNIVLSYIEDYGIDICYFNTDIKDKIDILEDSFNIVDSFKEGSEHILVLEPKDFSINF
jgi:hypothetical protein